jgi:hypothetical protein
MSSHTSRSHCPLDGTVLQMKYRAAEDISPEVVAERTRGMDAADITAEMPLAIFQESPISLSCVGKMCQDGGTL